MYRPLPTRAVRQRAFTLLEILVATAVLLLILSIVFRMIQGTTETWKSTTGKTEGFRGARTAFEALTRNLSQATLNTYFDYVDGSGTYRDPANPASFIPKDYRRRSDLHFLAGADLLSGAGVTYPIGQAVFFQAPLGYTNKASFAGMENLLNAVGYYVCYGPDPQLPGYLAGSTAGSKNRFRLMQFLQVSEELSIGDSTVTGGSPVWNNHKWYNLAISAQKASVSQLAENVVALVILPKLTKSDEDAGAQPLSTNYTYDSRDSAKPATFQQLPPVIQIVMVVIDDASAAKLSNSTSPPNLGLNNLFQNPAGLQDDLATLGRNLAGLPGNPAGNQIPLRYEIFQSEVAIRGAKWSTD